MNNQQLVGTTATGSSSNNAIKYQNSLKLTAQQARDAEELLSDWERGPFSHLTRLAIPHADASRGFNFTASGYLIDGLLSARVYSDSMTGLSGKNLDRDPVVADLVTSGWMEFTSGKKKHFVKPGQICIRDTRVSWEFACAPATNAHVVSIPRNLVLPHVGSPRVLDQAYLTDSSVPEVRFFVNYLEAIEKNSTDLASSITAQNMARSACAALISAILSDHPGAGLNGHQDATVAAAKKVIEEHLGNGDLTPLLIAQKVGVSLRTLHRYFSASNDSVMAFIRWRRLQKAHDELIARGSAVGISGIAVRWHFSDTSHFIRRFKTVYGATPATYLRDHGKGSL
ncbi:helix-turn-helix domain-containing protein [Streptomyces sp. NPDC088354]|uniref:helix-turn-helix domain-containing protein n=1 Tax=Streptomyces sp. NPDC088354 TaxID=3365856 RepID=UPI0038195B98